MASADRTQDHPVIRALQAHGGDAGFFEVVRLLQARSAAGSVPIGHQGPPSKEAVRFTPALDLSFGVHELDGCAVEPDGDRVDVTTRFFGLYGTASPLPACYTEQLLYEDTNGNQRAVLDLFNHRLLSFLWRTFAKYRQPVQFDGRGDDPATMRARILCQLERPGEPLPLLAFAGLLRHRPLSEGSLEQILTAVLRVPLEVRSCHVRRIAIPPHQCSALGQANCTLGSLAPLGDTVNSATTTYGLRVGPLPRVAYLDFLPGGARRRQLTDLLDRLVDDELDCALAVAIQPQDARPYALGDGSGGLGWTSWLGDPAAAGPHIQGDTVSHSLHRPTEPPMVA